MTVGACAWYQAGRDASTVSDTADAEAAGVSAAAAVDAVELVATCGRVELPGGLVVDVPHFGPPLSIADVAPAAGRLFVAAAHAVVGFCLADLRHSAVSGALAPSPAVHVPFCKLPGMSLRVRCGVICARPVVAVADCRGEVMVFLADLPGTSPRALRLTCLGKPGGGLDFFDDGPNAGFLFVGNASGQLIRWRLAVSLDGESLLEIQCSATLGSPRDGLADAQVVDLDVRNGRALMAALDGRLELWSNADGKLSEPPSMTLSTPLARVDCSESPTLWGARWVPLGSILQSGRACRRTEGAQLTLPNWAKISAELVCQRVLSFIPLCELACCIALLSRAHRLAVELELMDPERREQLAICFSDCTAWLLDEKLRVVARQDLPFCASYSHAAALAPCLPPALGHDSHAALATFLVAPKTDLVAAPGSYITVMPHVWALACSSGGGLRCPRLFARRLDLLPERDVVAAAALVTPTVGGGEARSAATPSPPRDAAHVLGLGICGDQLWTLLATGELLFHKAAPGEGHDNIADKDEG